MTQLTDNWADYVSETGLETEIKRDMSNTDQQA